MKICICIFGVFHLACSYIRAQLLYIFHGKDQCQILNNISV